MEFNEVVGTRRTIRWFKSWEPVEKEKVQAVLEAARLISSPGNLQPWHAVVVYRDELDDKTREELLAADNWQGGHTQAPVWVYFFADPDKASVDKFAAGTIELCTWGALPLAYGWSKERIIGGMERAEKSPAGMASIDEFLYDLPAERGLMMSFGETIAVTNVATLAAVNQGLGAALNLIAKPSKVERVKELLGVPERFVPTWLLLLGKPAEGKEAGGVRRKDPFEELFSEGTYGTPFERDENVVQELTEEKLIQPEAPLPQRSNELRFLARMYGYPEDPGM